MGLVLAPGMIRAQDDGRRDSSTVVPGPEYRAGGLRRTLFGKDYRPLWTTPIRVPVLDLQHFAGGIHPTEEGGGEQTHSLRFKNSAGREFQFRSVDKDAAGALPAELRETFIADIVRDQTSSGHPVGVLVVDPLLDAAGILHAPAVLYRMPDDSVLGEFRGKFANTLGTIEERPDSGFAGAADVVDTEHLVARLDDDPVARLDERELFAARLVDLMVGDWDRHEDQWRWALFGTVWRPIPRDRDQAFSRYDGWLISLARLVQPKLQLYAPQYPSLGGLIRGGVSIDQRLLSSIDRATADSIGSALKSRLSDSVLAVAVSRIPPEFPDDHRAWLLASLKSRRDRLDQAAIRFYRRLARVVDLNATNEAEVARIERDSRGVLISIVHGETTLYRRRFDPAETHEVRLFLRGGNDRIEVIGDPEATSRPLVRVVGGDGDDRFVGFAPGLRFYDASGNNTVEGRASLNRKRWSADADTVWPSISRHPDRGVRQRVLPTLGIAPDVGVLTGLDGWIDWYGFRRVPSESRLTFNAVFSTTRSSGRLRVEFTHQLENSPVFVGFEAAGSGIESLRWYGFGNETVQEDPTLFYRVRHNEVRVGGLTGLRLGQGKLSLGPVFRWASTPLQSGFNATQFIAGDQPYGTGSFKMAGALGRFVIDTRDVPGFARKGFRLSLSGEAYPRMLDTDSAVAKIEAQGSIAFAPIEIAKRRPSLHLMAGGMKTWGGLPYFLAPTLGGQERLRGYYADRFAGDAAVYGSAEVRLPITRFKLLLPGEQGVFGFVDVGRVSVRNQPSDTWHHTMGAGVWFSFLEARHVVSLALARPDRRGEGNRLIVSFGFPY